MNKRMHVIASHIEAGAGFIDVGTDHGYLPAWMASHGYNGNIIAADINSAPLQRAVETAEKAEVVERIEFQLCDGLEKCSPKAVDTIVIAGMGGDMICRILDLAEWCMDRRYKLILQPMTKSEILRYWLVNNEFEIITEELVLENGTVYQVLVARFGGSTKLSDAELFLGKKQLCTDAELYERRRQELVKRFQTAVSGMERNSAGIVLPALKLYRQILDELEKMEEYHD